MGVWDMIAVLGKAQERDGRHSLELPCSQVCEHCSRSSVLNMLSHRNGAVIAAEGAGEKREEGVRDDKREFGEEQDLVGQCRRHVCFCVALGEVRE